jgi:hypothetical protein
LIGAPREGTRLRQLARIIHDISSDEQASPVAANMMFLVSGFGFLVIRQFPTQTRNEKLETGNWISVSALFEACSSD